MKGKEIRGKKEDDKLNERKGSGEKNILVKGEKRKRKRRRGD